MRESAVGSGALESSESPCPPFAASRPHPCCAFTKASEWRGQPHPPGRVMCAPVCLLGGNQAHLPCVLKALWLDISKDR